MLTMKGDFKDLLPLFERDNSCITISKSELILPKQINVSKEEINSIVQMIRKNGINTIPLIIVDKDLNVIDGKKRLLSFIQMDEIKTVKVSVQNK
jgi:hypothetical protein